MTETQGDAGSDDQRKDIFPNTYWTRIIEPARGDDDTTAADAWQELITRYQKPVRTAVLSRLRVWLSNLPPDEVRAEADDVASDFFTYLLEQHILPRIDRSQGFRPYVVGVLKRYLVNYIKGRPEGAGLVPETDATASHIEDAIEVEDEARWAEEHLTAALEALHAENERNAAIICYYYGIRQPGNGEQASLTRQEIADRFGMNANSVDAANHRARKRLSELIEGQVMQTVGSATALTNERQLIVDRLLHARPGLFDS